MHCYINTLLHKYTRDYAEHNTTSRIRKDILTCGFSRGISEPTCYAPLRRHHDDCEPVVLHSHVVCVHGEHLHVGLPFDCGLVPEQGGP